MKVETGKVPFNDGVYVDVCGADMAILFQDVTEVSIAGGSNNFVSLRFSRVDSVLGSVTFPVDEAVKLVAELVLLGVVHHGQFGKEEVA